MLDVGVVFLGEVLDDSVERLFAVSDAVREDLDAFVDHVEVRVDLVELVAEVFGDDVSDHLRPFSLSSDFVELGEVWVLLVVDGFSVGALHVGDFLDVVDLAEINTISVTVTGSGNYEYAIDDITGPYQTSSFFNNVAMGIHDIYIRDTNGCGIVGPITIPVLGIPQYFTPNGDGFNDYWNVRGANAQFNYLSRIVIFDRFGKLLKQIGTGGLGWDGTYNGHPMPADDYWYNIQFEDGRSAKGHFTLKR